MFKRSTRFRGRGCVELIIGQIDDLQTRVQTIEKAIRVQIRSNEVDILNLELHHVT